MILTKKNYIQYNYTKVYKKYLGFGILELLLSFSLGLLVITITWKMVAIINKTWLLEKENIYLQQSARATMEILTDNIMNASYTGCQRNINTANVVTANASHDIWKTYFNKGIFGVAADTANTKYIDKYMKSEAIIVFTLDTDNYKNIEVDTENSYLKINTALKENNSENLLALLTNNCSQLALFTAKKIAKDKKVYLKTTKNSKLTNCSLNFQGDFDCLHNLGTDKSLKILLNSKLAQQLGYVFYVRYTEDIPSLYRKNIGSSYATPLVEGVEQLKFWYRIKNVNLNLALYLTSAQLGENTTKWQTVDLVCIEFVVRSSFQLLTEPQKYFFDGNWVMPEDRYLRQVYTTSIVLKNRII